MTTGRAKRSLFAVVLTVATCIAIEAAAYLTLRVAGRVPASLHGAFPVVNFFAFSPESSGTSFVARYRSVTDAYLVFDPTLGTRFRPGSWLYALLPDEKGYPKIATEQKLAVDPQGFVANSNTTDPVRDYAELVRASDVLRVVVSGGSTTAGWGASDNEHTWPALLETLLNRELARSGGRFQRAAVINSGVFGYNAAQELKRFQDETLYLDPHVVVVFNGINETWNYRGNPVDYAVRPAQFRLTDPLNFGTDIAPSVLFPYANTAIQVFQRRPSAPHASVYGFRSEKYIESEAASLYQSKVAQFHSICEGEGIRFIYCLQPIMGMGEKVLSADEHSRTNFFGSDVYPESWEAYTGRGRAFYERVKQDLAADWQHDLSGLFDGVDATVYSDPRHYNDLGNRIVAERIAELVTETVP